MAKTYDLGPVTAYAEAVAHGYVGTEEQFAAELTGATAAARAAAQDAEDAEAYAIGKRNGTDVTSTDPAYHNNAKYYSETLQVDDTLSVAGRAADAKAVGDELTDLRGDLDDLPNITSSSNNVIDFALATSGAWYHTINNNISFVPVSNQYTSTYVAQRIILDTDDNKLTIKADGSDNTNIYCYYFTDDNGNLLSSSGSENQLTNEQLKQGTTLTIPNGATNLLISFQYGVDVYNEMNTNPSNPSMWIRIVYGANIPSDWALNGTRYYFDGHAIAYLDDVPNEETITSIINRIINDDTANDNIIDFTLATSGAWYYTDSNNISFTPITNQYTSTYVAQRIVLENGKTKISIKARATTNARCYTYYFTNDTGALLSASGVNTISYEQLSQGMTLNIPDSATNLLLSLANFTDVYNEMNTNPSNPSMWIRIVYGDIPDDEDDTDYDTTGILKTPSKYDLIVGDTFELFKCGILNVLNADYYDIEFNGQNLGKMWKRKYEFTPSANDTGQKSYNVIVRDNVGKVVDTKQLVLNINAVPSSPSTEKVIVCMGDSLTAAGTWCQELRRRLISNDGSPVGYGLSNITFIGTKTTSDGTKYEGTGGWAYSNYLSSGSPFYDSSSHRNNFITYASRMGVDHIDHMIILLGWNSTPDSKATYKNYIKTFLNQVFSDMPNCKITLVGLQRPSRNGFANNYGISWPFYQYYQHVWKVEECNREVANEYTNGNVDYINLSGQFDSDYCFPTITQNVNTRTDIDIQVQSNGVHPADNGQYQIADAILRNLVSKL